ncbi:SusC/RagA family TonB-linked outer membrane protein [Flavivirga jejuensis]|uniref:TonB-dependent receptor n=1 Tax=Flavivirga jejuensis TaxID=870487 RepID=A0ABT8WR15_9FLAO|nr:TonB-dependent receptor [Flavivirga jejuensis]MDO5975618.1 TonB-dependent receptor [Flavivirga jejuensis]
MKIKLIKLRSIPGKRLPFMIMRIIILLLCTTVFSLAPKPSFSQEKVIINQDQWVTIDKVFKIIKDQTNYTFIYRSDLFENYPKVLLKKGTIKANKLLEKTLPQEEFVYSFSADKTIVIKIKVPIQNTIPQTIQHLIRGTVVSDKGEPLPGVNVIIKGAKTGTSTDFDGKYSLNLRDGDVKSTVLIFSYLGFKTQEIVVDSRTDIDVTLIPDFSGLDEVVVIGYGTSKVRDVTGTISSISAGAIKTAPLGATAESLIQGKAAGVNVQIQSASPTSPISVIIRGGSSLSGTNQPLWVIDGVPQYAQSDDGNIFGLLEGDANNIFYNLNLDDIQSIDILKDASATAIYGSRATNGVVLVTTKKGSYNSKPVFEISTNVGISVADWNDFDYLERDEYVDFLTNVSNEDVLARGNPGFSRFILDRSAFFELNTSEFDGQSTFALLPDAFNTESQVSNWLDLLTQSPITTTHSFSARGGSENTSYFTSFSYNKTEGVVKTGFSERYSGRINFDTKFSKNLKFGLNLSGSTREADNKDASINNLKTTRPDFQAYNPDGTLFLGNDGFTQNPLLDLENDNLSENVIFQGTAYLEARFLKDFLFRTAFSNNYVDTESVAFKKRGSLQVEEEGLKQTNLSTTSSNIWENTLNYKKIFNEKHDVTGLLGYTFERSNRYQLNIQGNGFPDNEVLDGFGSASFIDFINESESDNALISQFARGQYQFDKRYIVSGTIRRDGSSRFGANRRWGYFPSGAIAWVVSGEKFMQSDKMQKYVPFLKLRASFGRTGGQDIGNFDHLSTFAGTTYNGAPGLIPNSIGNRNLQWEETDLLDLGIDFSLFNGRVSGTLGKYKKQSREALFTTNIATSSSFTEVPTNIGSLDNDGYEISLNYDIIRTKNHHLTFNFNWATNDTKVTKINGTTNELFFPDFSEPFQRLVEGGAVDEWWGFQTAGRFFDSAEDAASFRPRTEDGGVGLIRNSRGEETKGDIIYIDQNGDGEITDEDRVNIGSATPDGFGGFGFGYTHKGLRINATFVYAYGHKRLWEDAFRSGGGVAFENQSNSIVGQSAGVVDVRDAQFPRITLFSSVNSLFSDAYLFDASYLRLSQVSIGYSLPKKVFKNSTISGIDITLQGTNLFTITNYPGIDPQGNFTSTQLGTGLGVDASTFPQTQGYNLGIRVTL